MGEILVFPLVLECPMVSLVALFLCFHQKRMSIGVQRYAFCCRVFGLSPFDDFTKFSLCCVWFGILTKNSAFLASAFYLICIYALFS